MSQHLFNMISPAPNGERRPFEYAFLRQYGYIHLLCPNFLKIFDTLRAELVAAER
jgi:hypothetical protein